MSIALRICYLAVGHGFMPLDPYYRVSSQEAASVRKSVWWHNGSPSPVHQLPTVAPSSRLDERVTLQRVDPRRVWHDNNTLDSPTPTLPLQPNTHLPSLAYPEVAAMPGLTEGGNRKPEQPLNNKPATTPLVSSSHENVSPDSASMDNDRGTTDSEADPQLLKWEMSLTWLEDKNVRLDLENASLESRLSTLDSENKLLKEHLGHLQDCDLGMKQHIIALDKEIAMERNKTKDIKKEQAMDLAHVRDKSSALQAKILELSDELESLKMENQRVQSRNASQLSERGILVQENEDLRAKNRLLQASVDRTDVVGSQLSAQLARLDLNARTKDEDEATIQRLSAENKELLEKNGRVAVEYRKRIKEIACLKQELHDSSVVADKYKAFKDETQKLKANLDTVEATKVALQYQVNSMHDENSRLRTTNKTQYQEIASLKQRPAAPQVDPSLRQLRLDMAYYITEFDLTEAGLRAYTCIHDSLSDVQGPKTTRVRPTWFIANSMFRDWENDGVFMEEYKLCREYVLEHHNAHQQQSPGRGDEARVIKERCKSVVLLVVCLY